ncbi:TPA: hypothetical protein QDB51_002701 [Burkholderia vietnamiensis]|nr:hypothetical protein [Burkholderia vietnamiensis]
METITEFIERTEKEATVDIAKEKLSALLELLPEANGDLLLHNLGLLPEDKKQRLMSLVQSEGVANNKAVLVSILGMLVSFKTVTDAIEAATLAENHIIDKTTVVTKELLEDFKETLTSYVAVATEELNKSKNELASETEENRKSREEIKLKIIEAIAEIEKAYLARTQHLKGLEARINEKLAGEVAKAKEETKKVFGELAAKELRTAILPVVLKALGWRGFLSAVGAVTCGIFLHDFIVYVALKVFH